MSTLSKPVGPILALLALCLFGQPAQAKYSSGTGEPNDPYQIATAEDLIALGEDPNDYDKHFILTADIDLDPNLPGRKVFDKAVIGGGTYSHWVGSTGTPFTGVFDGNGRTILHMTIRGRDYLGLFGQLGSGAEVKNLGMLDVMVTGLGNNISGIVGYNLYGSIITTSYATGSVTGNSSVGGLVGWNGGALDCCYSIGGDSPSQEDNKKRKILYTTEQARLTNIRPVCPARRAAARLRRALDRPILAPPPVPERYRAGSFWDRRTEGANLT